LATDKLMKCQCNVCAGWLRLKMAAMGGQLEGCLEGTHR
jgi:hypothetical protein